MESMASGCCIVASNTPPVREMINSGEQGHLVDFFDPDALSQQVDHLLQNPEKRKMLGQAARERILDGGYDLQSTLNQQMKLMKQVIRG